MIIKKVLLNKYKHDDRFSRINQLSQPVKELYYLGDNLFELLDKPCVAIVGSRKVSSYGRQVTESITKELVKAGVVIISGLALGIDSIAHQIAINNHGFTIAVLPSGLDRIYPASHRNLAKQILNYNGCLISEYPINSNPPMKYQFIARNRIIAALAEAILIPEAAEKSGSLHTANFALELGSDIFAVPGNINSPNSKGTNRLIQNGATPLLQSSDLLETLGIYNKKPSNNNQFNEKELLIINLLKKDITNNSLLVSNSKLPITEYNITMTNLELKEIIKNNGNDSWSLLDI